jgi:predicted unusual protein kinase regulating ubiquinone biosynthesis (AarF/ABC1/UbiB family)
MSGRSQLQRALLDAATILSSAANIARRAAINIDPGSVASGSGQNQAQNVSKTATTPWPSQTIALHRKQPQDVFTRRKDAAPSAPDGSLTGMKVLNAGSDRSKESNEQDNLQENEDLIRQLDDSLKGYFDGTEPVAHSKEKPSGIPASAPAPDTPPSLGSSIGKAQEDVHDSPPAKAASSKSGGESVSIEETSDIPSLLRESEQSLPAQGNTTESQEDVQDSPEAQPARSRSEEGQIKIEETSDIPSLVQEPEMPFPDSDTTTDAREDVQEAAIKSDSETSRMSEPLSDRIMEAPTPNDEAEIDRSTETSSSTPPSETVPIEEYDATLENSASPLRAAKVPSSRVARLLHYGSLGAGLAWGAAGSYLGGGGSQGKEGKQFMSDSNVRRLVDKLSTMRGAALKLGQFMSIQDSNLLPEQIEQVMLRVQNSANYMPVWQMEKVMREDLGSEWRKSFSSFNDVPFASASIGQVHIATLAEDHPSPLAGKKVAVKIQFPGVRESIGSDLNNLRWLVSASALLPKGLFLDNTIRVMRRELDDECDYEREKEMCKRFGTLLNGKGNFAVPLVVDELCSKRVLTCEMMKGRPLTQAARYSQEKRDNIARSILRLSLEELFTYRLMQTDPNWTNFLYNEQNGKIELIDFGATRAYDKTFMDDWLCMLRAAIGGKREECIKWSEKVGYLTGKETEGMQDAHVDSMIALGEPFRPDAPNPYPFAEQTITARVRKQIPLMLKERLTPPPAPTYSLNRKLSGAFLLCARLKANVECRTMLQDVTKDYVLDNQEGPISGNVGSLGLGKRGIHTTSMSVDQEERRRRERTIT